MSNKIRVTKQKGKIMGIKSTQYISRQDAIERISEQVNYLVKGHYYNLQQRSSEDNPLNGSMIKYLEDEILKTSNVIISDLSTLKSLDYLNHLTDKMLEDIIDLPFIRYSMFENYIINESEELL